MRSLEEREAALNMYFRDGKSYKFISITLNIPVNTIQSWCKRYCEKMGIPPRGKTGLRSDGVRREDIHSRIPKDNLHEDRIARLEMEVDLLRNFLILTEGRKVKTSQVYAVIKRFSRKYEITSMCRFYKVSRSGYYGWAKGNRGTKDHDKELIKLIAECHKKHKRRYGYRRIVKWLKNEKGLIVNHKRVWRITSSNNLLSVIRRKKPFRYVPNGNLRYDNVMNREFSAEKPNEKWVTDISYIIVPEGTLYLSAIRDLCGNFIVAHKTAKSQDYTLVRNTIEQAVTSENSPKNLILHSDGGGQYRSWDYYFQVTAHGLTPSMSRPARCGDNAMAENFFSTFKTESIYLEKPQTLIEAEKLTDDFVHYYNYERIQGNGLTPFEERESARLI